MARDIVIFDMDGTLIDSALDITSSINYVRSTLQLPPLGTQEVIIAINSEKRNLAKIFYNQEIYADRERRMFEEHYYDECIKNVSAYEDIPLLLQILKQNDVLCSVATNAPSPFAKRMLEHLDLAHYFDYMLGADLHASKPDPHMINTILTHYGYQKEHHGKAIMVGDNSKDLLAAKNAGIDGVFVTWGFAKDAEEKSISNPLELLKLLDL